MKSRSSQALPASPLHGVNLGGWLVLEKWMTPSVFRGLATDEYSLWERADEKVVAKIIAHRENFVTLADFEWLRDHGIEAVRLPVGYWVFGGNEPYRGCIEYVDRAFQWAAQTGIRILLDVHAAPGSQNGNDHSGRAGKVRWAKDNANILRTLQLVQQLARRYAGNQALLGIELLNEPSRKLRRSVLLRYYRAAYSIIRAECGEDAWVVFSDGFKARRWKRKLRGRKYQNMYIDTHHYQTFGKKDKSLSLPAHIRAALTRLPIALRKMRKAHPVIVGEWSLALDEESLSRLTPSQWEIGRRAYGAAQLLAYEQTDAWFFWSYKTEGGGVWSYRDCVERCWLPPDGYQPVSDTTVGTMK